MEGLEASERELKTAENDFITGENSIDDWCPERGCSFQFRTREHLYMHGYRHFRVPRLVHFANAHKAHILGDFEFRGYEMDELHRTFNVPIQPGTLITENLIGRYLLDIRKIVNCSFKVKMGVSRILQSKEPVDVPELKFFRTTHDAPLQKNLEYSKRGSILDTETCGPLHPYTVTNLRSIYRTASAIQSDVENEMLDARPDSSWQLICPTNIRFYCYLLDFAGGYHVKDASLPQHLLQSSVVVDPVPPSLSGQNACALWAIVRHFDEKRRSEM